MLHPVVQDPQGRFQVPYLDTFPHTAITAQNFISFDTWFIHIQHILNMTRNTIQHHKSNLNNLKLISSSYKDNYRREGIRVANARPKVIIFCKSRWDLVTLQ